MSVTIAIAIGARLRELGRWAGRFPSMGFGVLYLLAIPGFAAFYALLPFDFYNNTARYEPLISAQKEQFAKVLRENFLAEGPILDGARVQESADRMLPMITIQPESDKVRLLVWVIGIGPRRAGDPLVRVAVDLDGFSTIKFSENMTRQPWNTLGSVSVRAQMLSSQDIDLAALFPCSHGQWPEKAICMSMTLEQYSDLLSLSNTELGRPTGLQNSYWRMLYFSAVTMSTLGYGDIVPVTGRARTLVTLQVILGPVIFGLFLNALASERIGHPVARKQGSEEIHVAP